MCGRRSALDGRLGEHEAEAASTDVSSRAHNCGSLEVAHDHERAAGAVAAAASAVTGAAEAGAAAGRDAGGARTISHHING